MQGNSHFDAQDNPRLNPPGHWAAGLAAYVSDGLDELAGDIGLPDGGALILKITGHGPDDIARVGGARFRAWFEECYYAVRPGARKRPGDVVMYNSVGIFSTDSGMDFRAKSR
jgi:hypothetical protein